MKKVKRRGRIRKSVIFGSFILFPVVYYYLSPYLIIAGASEGVITGSFVVFGLMFLSSLFLGRAFCGWICPGGGEQEYLERFRDKRFPGGRLDWIKYLVWIPWLSIIVVMFVRSGGIKSFDFLYNTFCGISVQNIGSAILFLVIAGVIALLAFTLGRRGFCHTACWMAPFMVIGRKTGNGLKLPALRLKSEPDRCIECEICSKNCPMSLDVMEILLENQMENSECVLCGTCIDECPEDVIRYSFSRAKFE